MSYWTAAQLQPNRERLALHMLTQERFTVYAPRLRERRTIRGRREGSEVPLFPGYCFVSIALQWHAARWCPGVVRLVMDGLQPAKVPDAVIEEIRGRERNGAIEPPSVGSNTVTTSKFWPALSAGIWRSMRACPRMSGSRCCCKSSAVSNALRSHSGMSKR
jgi:hypothetical protein